MATAASTLVQRARRMMRDWPDQDALTAAITTTSQTAVTVADTTAYMVGEPIEIEQEVLLVTALTDAVTLTVRRGMYGSTAATHANGAAILINPAFYAIEYLDALNEAMQSTFPKVYRPWVDTSLTGVTDQYEYTVPTMTGIGVPIPFVHKIDIKLPSDLIYREGRSWEIVRDANSGPLIKFRYLPVAGSTVRVHGYGPFTPLASVAATLDTYFPAQAEHVLTIGAAYYLLDSGEAGRVRVDSGAVDDREQANRAGSSSAQAARLEARFYRRLDAAAMPPMPRHIKSTL